MTQHFPPEGGAHAGRWAWLSAGLADRGHHLDVVVPRWANREHHRAATTNIDIHEVRAVVPGLSLRRRIANEALTALQTLAQSLVITPPDVVMATAPALASLPTGWLVSKLRRRPLVVELRDAWPHLFADMPEWSDDGTHEPTTSVRAARLAPLLTAAFWRMLHDASAIITTTESLAQDLRQRGLPHVEVARNTAMPTPLLPPVSEDHTELRVLYLGVLGRAQRLAVAIDAAALLADSDTTIRLRMVGEGAHKHALETHAHRLGVDVEWVDRVPESETREHLEWADTVLICLRKWHGMTLTVPSKLYPTMIAGRHITGSVEGETAHIIGETGAGDVVPPEDPRALADLWRALAHDRNRLRVDGTAREWALSTSAETSVDQVEVALNAALDSPRLREAK